MMKKANIRICFSILLLATMVYPLLFQALHVIHEHHFHQHHDHQHHHAPVHELTLQEKHTESPTHCYICDYHLSQYHIQETTGSAPELPMCCPRKTKLPDYLIRPYDGSDLALRAPPVFM